MTHLSSLTAQQRAISVKPDAQSSLLNYFSFENVQLASRFLERSLKDSWPSQAATQEPKLHLAAAVQWMKHCHDQNPDDGVSWGYSLKGSWRESYRETSGYIANTLFELAKRHGDDDARSRAIDICYWLVTAQEANGSIANPRYGKGGIVFDTGQVLQGFIRGYQETQESSFLDAALAAGSWLVNVSDSSSGQWVNSTHNGVPHVYNTRVAWKLVELSQIQTNLRFIDCARANLDWAVDQQVSSGFFEQCAFVEEEPPFTHTIAYAIRGLLESGLLLNEQKYIESALKGAKAVLERLHDNGFLPGQIDVDGRSVGQYCCLTGNCQMSIIWFKLFKLTGEQQFYDAAVKSLQYVMSSQDIETQDLNIHGGIKGSLPIWGKYTRLSYPNWATKFFIDALLIWEEFG